jgi:hypothetical protein
MARPRAERPLFSSILPYEVDPKTLIGDMTQPMFVSGTQLLALLTSEGANELILWDVATRDLRTLLEDEEGSGISRCTMTERGAAVVRLGGEGPWLEGRPGEVLFVHPDGTRVKLFDKEASHQCPGGDGLGSKRDFADVDERGRIAIAHEHAVSVFDRDGHLLARREVAFRAPMLEGWYGDELVWTDVDESGPVRRRWRPADGHERVAPDLTLTSRSIHGAELRVQSPGSPPFTVQGGTDRVSWRLGGSGEWEDIELPQPRSFFQWFAGHYVLCTAAEGAPYAVDTRTRRIHRLFKKNLGVLSASPSMPTVLVIDGEQLGIADASCLARDAPSRRA